MPLEDEIDFSKMSEQELEEFAKERFKCLYHSRESFEACHYCDGYNNRCGNIITASHLESFYKLFEWKKCL